MPFQLLLETQGLRTSARQMNSQINQLIKIKPVWFLSTNISVCQGRVYFPSTLLTEGSNLISYYNTKGFLRLIHPKQHNHIAFRRIPNMLFPLPTKLICNSILALQTKHQNPCNSNSSTVCLFAYLDTMETNFTEL